MEALLDYVLTSTPTDWRSQVTPAFLCACSYVVMMPKKRQALVEFEELNGACACVNFAVESQIYVGAQPAFVNYSTSQKISRPGDSDDSRNVNNILLFTVMNPIYPITTVG